MNTVFIVWFCVCNYHPLWHRRKTDISRYHGCEQLILTIFYASWEGEQNPKPSHLFAGFYRVVPGSTARFRCPLSPLGHFYSFPAYIGVNMGNAGSHFVWVNEYEVELHGLHQLWSVARFPFKVSSEKAGDQCPLLVYLGSMEFLCSHKNCDCMASGGPMKDQVKNSACSLDPVNQRNISVHKNVPWFMVCSECCNWITYTHFHWELPVWLLSLRLIRHTLTRLM